MGYQQILDEKDVDLTLLLDTHAHADHISGGPALAKISGAPYYMHPYDSIHPFDMLPATLDYEMLRSVYKDFVKTEEQMQDITSQGPKQYSPEGSSSNQTYVLTAR